MDNKTCAHCAITFLRPDDAPIPDDRCEQCNDWPEGRMDAIGQNGPDGLVYDSANQPAPRESDAVSLVWTEGRFECLACGSYSGLYHSPECPRVNAFQVGRIPQVDEVEFSAIENVHPKQSRYQDATGEDWIDEFARTATVDEFRGAMRFTIGKYNRRAGKKDALLSEIRKMEDYCRRWAEYEQRMERKV